MEKKNKENVCVIFGGKSVEHDISIITGVQLLKSLDKNKYNIIPIYITKEGVWLENKDFFDIKTFSKNSEIKGQEVFLQGKSLFIKKKNRAKKKIDIDFVYLALHGSFGENGSIQGLLEMNNISYSSCNVLGSSVTMDKYQTKLVCKALNIKVAKYKIVLEDDFVVDFENVYKDLKFLSFPVIVKPNSLGSSIGITFCKNKMELRNALSFAFLFDDKVIVEKVIDNLRELNLSVMGNSYELELSNIEEVKITKDFLTFENKYMGNKKKSSSGMENLDRIVPAHINKEVKDKIEEYGKTFYKKLGLKGVVRIDFLLDDKTNEVYLNEANSIPGSMANYLWKDKYNFNEFLEKLKDYSIKEKFRKDKKLLSFSSSVLSNYKEGSKILK